MTLRGTAAHLGRPRSWRRSGDESYWESLMSEPEVVPRVSRRSFAPRPQSAIEGGQMDSWLQQLERMQGGHSRDADHGRVPSFYDRASSMSTLNKEPTGSLLRQHGAPSFYSRDFSSSGNTSLCESLRGSQESIQTGLSSVPGRRGSLERVHITQAPEKEQAKLCSLAPVKIGWLPIQRRVMVTDTRNQKQYVDNSASQVKLKQPITPTFKKHPTRANDLDSKVEESHTSPPTSVVRTWQATDQGSPRVEQVQEKVSAANKVGDRPFIWQSLRRGWPVNRAAPLCEGNQSNNSPTGTSSDPTWRNPLRKTTSLDPYNTHSALQRTTSVQPAGSKAPLNRTDGVAKVPHIETRSAVATLVPKNNTGFSSITISSKKVTRSASLPAGSKRPTFRPSDQTKTAPTLPHLHQEPMDGPNPNVVTLQRNATIVKVTEHRMMSSPAPQVKGTEVQSYNDPPSEQISDTLVHRRKATIIKVSEHRESYSPARAGSRSRNPEYRHSFTEGLYRENSMWQQGPLDPPKQSSTPSYHHLQSSAVRTNYALTPNTSTSVVLRNPENRGGTVHRSTLSLFLNNPLAIAGPAPTDPSPRTARERTDRPRRPLSCYGNVSGRTEPGGDDVTKPAIRRKWSFGLPGDTTSAGGPNDSFPNTGTAVKETAQPVAESTKPNGHGGGGGPPAKPQDSFRRPSPSLTLIKAPDPGSPQTPQEILALNAAAIIANIKLQRQRSKKRTAGGDSEKDPIASPRGNTATDVGNKRADVSSDQNPVGHGVNTAHPKPAHTGFVPLNVESGPERPAKSISLKEALETARPDFIRRSQERLREMGQRAQERRALSGSAASQSNAMLGHKRRHGSQLPSQSDNLFKPRDRAIIGKEVQRRSKGVTTNDLVLTTDGRYSTLPGMKRNTEEDKNKQACLTNRQRVELFKKKLLDQILQRGND